MQAYLSEEPFEMPVNHVHPGSSEDLGDEVAYWAQDSGGHLQHRQDQRELHDTHGWKGGRFALDAVRDARSSPALSETNT